MPKLRVNPIVLLAGLGTILIAAIATIWFNPKAVNWIEQKTSINITSKRAIEEADPTAPSTVVDLAAVPAEERAAKLQEIASARQASLDRSRARYLLAVDLIQKYEGGPAIRQLEGLEDEYPLLAPYVLLKQGRAYELTNEKIRAEETWQKLIESYPNSPIVVEAYYKLGQSQPEYWDKAIAEYPNHPRTLDILRERLKTNPNQPQLLVQIVKSDFDAEGSSAIRDRLVKDFANQLKPDDWLVVADGYWKMGEYKKAATAYVKATSTPESAYRLARSLQVSDQKEQAKTAYKSLIQKFPDAEETGLGLRRLAAMSSPQEAVQYLDRVINKFPNDAPDALLEKAKILDKTNGKAAAQARQTLLAKYPNTDAAADYRWETAQKYADQNDLVKAWQWAQPITTNNADSNVAPKAAFWVGKWAQRLGRAEDSKAAFEHVIARHTHSYYAWRAAVLLGWDVGDFNSVRQTQPELVKPKSRPSPTAGSQTFQELYRLRLEEEARTLFNAEVGDRELTVDEQFTEGLLKLTEGKNLQGIAYIGSLRDRDKPEDREQWQALRQKSEYWYALFPFPYYQTIVNWSQQRQINPVLVTSLIRQESRFEKEIRSPVGAVGLMQVMPETGKWVAGQIQLEQYSLTNPEDNIKIGTWYFDYTHREYSGNSLLAVASYNAGPGNVNEWRKRFNTSDPDVFVEKIPFRETKGYVESVFGNYWNYLCIYNPDVAGLVAQHTNRKPVSNQK